MKIMTRKQLKEYIKQNIKEILSEGVAYMVRGNQTSPTVQTFKDDSQAKEFDKDATNATVKRLEEMSLNEMAGFYKVKDKAGFKKALKTYKELKGDKFNKNALDRLLVALDKEGEVEITPFSKALKKDPATFNNSNTRAALEKEGGEFTDYIDAYKSKPKDKEEPKKETPKKEEPKVKKEAPKKEAPKKEAPKKEAPKKEAPKKEVPKKKTKDEDNEEVEDEDAMDKKAQAAAKNLDLDFFDFDDEDDF
jgi:hypothetical protein